MVIRRRIHESRENSAARVFCNRHRIETGSGCWINLEDSVVRVVQGEHGVRRWRVKKLWRGLAIDSFSYMF